MRVQLALKENEGATLDHRLSPHMEAARYSYLTQRNGITLHIKRSLKKESNRRHELTAVAGMSPVDITDAVAVA
ncbi:hypothetical protein EYF80_027640 [Liparis tanakae]|uniref:Uncharacterized protein n=1 Tax=Liparis tanakae TaxID=230148 RepID=A0A4Z2H9G1_9TELE|nr:hypothetical protein EYF80_027640 [Liparis tanakae]